MIYGERLKDCFENITQNMFSKTSKYYLPCVTSPALAPSTKSLGFVVISWRQEKILDVKTNICVMLEYYMYSKCRQEELKLNLTYGLFHSILRGRSLTFDRPMDELVAPNVGSDQGTPSSACFFRILSKF